MTSLPREARDGLMRAWLEILKERHPEVTWIAQAASLENTADQNSPVDLQAAA
jgi:hypothetical protein